MSSKIIFNGKGKPWSQKKDAFKHLVEKNLEDYAVMKHGGGWALVLLESLEPEPEAKAERKAMTYRRVIFNPRLDKTHPTQVVLGCNSVNLVITRGIETIVPESHLEIAKNAVHQVWEFNEEGNVTECVGTISKYLYQDLGSATKAEYDKMRSEGNKKVKAKFSTIED